jgi:hypothetical protein
LISCNDFLPYDILEASILIEIMNDLHVLLAVQEDGNECTQDVGRL